MAIKVKREELYDQVWTNPMVKVAAHYRVSGTGLRKICDRQGVPVPDRGHWAKKNWEGCKTALIAFPRARIAGINCHRGQ